MRKGICFVISGPSGAGKGTVATAMVERFNDLCFSVSATNRAPRQGEVDGVNYYFVSNEKFDQMIAEGDFLEYVEKYENRYGTPKSGVMKMMEAGTDVILDIETIGAENVKKAIPEAVTIFILPPSIHVLRKRLMGRGSETEKTLELRLSQACEEIGYAKNYDYIVINDDKTVCIDTVASIIQAERNKGFRNLYKTQTFFNN